MLPAYSLQRPVRFSGRRTGARGGLHLVLGLLKFWPRARRRWRWTRRACMGEVGGVERGPARAGRVVAALGLGAVLLLAGGGNDEGGGERSEGTGSGSGAGSGGGP